MKTILRCTRGSSGRAAVRPSVASAIRCDYRVHWIKRRTLMKYVVMALLVAGSIPSATAQAGPPPAWSPAKSIGMFAYPKNQQNPDQQLRDESDCYGSARQNSGFDPQAP